MKCIVKVNSGQFGSSKAPVTYEVCISVPGFYDVRLDHFTNREEAEEFAKFLFSKFARYPWEIELTQPKKEQNYNACSLEVKP